MEQQQRLIEEKYSRTNIRSRIAADVDLDNPVLKSMVIAIDSYRRGTYYPSKLARVRSLLPTSIDIALEILVLVLPIKEVSPIQAIAAQLGAVLNYNEILDGVKTASELIAVCEVSKAYDIYHSSDFENETGTLGIKPNYSLNSGTASFIDQTKYLPPMVCEPAHWANNIDGGYLTPKSSVILGQMNHHMGHQSLDVINILQDIAWQINPIVDFQEIPNKELDTPEKIQQFNTMKEQSTQVYNELMENGNEFHFVWKFDKRGRMYSQGYHCNLQGTEYKKAILSFAKEELIQ